MKRDYSKIKVCHLTSVHPVKDGRIFYKECTSLANAGYDVTLIVAGAADEICNRVKIVGVPKAEGRLGRILKTTRNVYKKALEINADIYHLHDPELLPVGLRLKKKGKKVIFDSHEDYTANIKEKPYLNSYIAKIIAACYTAYERYVLRRYDAVVSVTPHLTERLKNINCRTYQVTNYKQTNNKGYDVSVPRNSIGNTVSFVGPIRDQWCIREIIDSLSDDISLKLAGPAEDNYIEILKHQSNWNKVNYLGKVQPQEVETIYQTSCLGFALLRYSLAVGNNIGTLGNTKIFEIMGAGIPVICTDFILWKDIIEKYKCGICIDPTNVSAIKEAISYILNNPKEAKQMGENGKVAVEVEFNWESQVNILLNMYETLLINIANKK